MKTVLPLLFVLLSLCTAAQHDPASIKKYQLALPNQWMGKKNLLTHLVQVATTVFPSLEGKQFCLKCKTPYTLMFFYDSVVVINKTPVSLASSINKRGTRISNYECVTTFKFKATWTLLYKDSAIAELELIREDQEFTARKKFNLQRDIRVSYHDGKPPRTQPNPGDNPMIYINNNTAYFDPTINDILRAIEQKIRKIKPE